MENEEKLKIGVVVPCTRADTIARCLDSLLKQSRYADEIIVVQANDKDIQRALDSFQQEKGVNIKRVFAPGPGVVKALNAGIRNCATDIICFIDDDACAKEDWIKLIEGHYKDHNVAGVGGRDILHCQGKIFQKRVKNVGKISWYGKIVGNHHNITNVVKSVDFLKGCNTSYRRESIPPLDENLGLGRETRTDPHWEIDIGLLIKKSGRKILFDPHIMVDHYINTPAQEWLDRGTAAARNEIYILFKHLGILRKAVYLFYIFCIGQKTNPGFVWFILDIFETGGIRNAWNRFSIFTKCKIEGIKLYFRKYKNLKA